MFDISNGGSHSGVFLIYSSQLNRYFHQSVALFSHITIKRLMFDGYQMIYIRLALSLICVKRLVRNKPMRLMNL